MILVHFDVAALLVEYLIVYLIVWWVLDIRSFSSPLPLLIISKFVRCLKLSLFVVIYLFMLVLELGYSQRWMIWHWRSIEILSFDWGIRVRSKRLIGRPLLGLRYKLMITNLFIHWATLNSLALHLWHHSLLWSGSERMVSIRNWAS